VTVNRLAVVSAQDATPAAECTSTTPEENKAMLAEFQQALFSGSDVSGYLSPSFAFHDASGEVMNAPGNDDTTTWANSRREDYPDQSFNVDMVVAEGDMVAAYLSWSGTQKDDEEDTGVPATGKRADWVSAVFFRFDCGKIADVWSISDDLGRLEDLGVITEEELQSAEPAATPAA
jgi:predicted ester cyclase